MGSSILRRITLRQRQPFSLPANGLTQSKAVIIPGNQPRPLFNKEKGPNHLKCVSGALMFVDLIDLKNLVVDRV